jgi:hypothetical protein
MTWWETGGKHSRLFVQALALWIYYLLKNYMLNGVLYSAFEAAVRRALRVAGVRELNGLRRASDQDGSRRGPMRLGTYRRYPSA